MLLLAALFIGIPFFWMVTTSLKSPAEVAVFPPIWWPKNIRWNNFSTAWNLAPFGKFYVNSIITATTGGVLEVTIAALSAYAFARIKFKYRNFMFMIMLAPMMIPSQVALIPNYVVLKHLKWINTYQGHRHPARLERCSEHPFAQSLSLRAGSASIDAAEIDGLGHLKTMTLHRPAPARPVLGTLVLYLFLRQVEQLPVAIDRDEHQSMRTLPVGLAMVRTAEYAIGPEHLMAASLFVLVPPLIVYFLAQRQLIEGIAAGAVKG